VQNITHNVKAADSERGGETGNETQREPGRGAKKREREEKHSNPEH
jgi:hypothetical protein